LFAALEIRVKLGPPLARIDAKSLRCLKNANLPGHQRPLPPPLFAPATAVALRHSLFFPASPFPPAGMLWGPPAFCSAFTIFPIMPLWCQLSRVRLADQRSQPGPASGPPPLPAPLFFVNTGGCTFSRHWGHEKSRAGSIPTFFFFLRKPTKQEKNPSASARCWPVFCPI